MRPVGHEQVLRDVGRRIAEVRRSRPWTQEQFAEALGVSVRYVQLVEAGSENLTIETLVKFSNSLHISVAALFESPASTKAGPGRPRRHGHGDGEPQ